MSQGQSNTDILMLRLTQRLKEFQLRDQFLVPAKETMVWATPHVLRETADLCYRLASELERSEGISK